jgi:hypothetical protein
MRDAVVDEGTYSKYVNDIIVFMDWLRVDMISWLTPFCSEKYDEISLLREDEGKKERRARIKASWMNLVKNASSNPLINIDQMTLSSDDRNGRLPIAKGGHRHPLMWWIVA